MTGPRKPVVKGSDAAAALPTTLVATEGNKNMVAARNYEFKAPKPKVRRKKIMDEDTYVSTMEYIIRRDYFPDLHRAEKTRLKTPGGGGTPGVGFTPRGTPTPGGAPSVGHRLRGDTPASQLKGTSFEDDTPLTRGDVDPLDKFEPGTPRTEASSSVVSIARKKSAKDLSLDQFCGTHTSEDNASFQDLLAKDRLKQKQKYWWLKEKDIQANQMAIKGCGDSSSTGRVKFWDYTNKNALMYVPDGLPPPKSIAASSSSSSSSFKPEKKTMAVNTRFPGTLEQQVVEDYLQANRPPSSTRPHHEGTPMIRGYKLMRTPSPSPSASGEAPIVTWGDVASTPMHLREEDPMDKQKDVDLTIQESVFRVPEMPKREKLGLKLGEQARIKRAKRKRSKTPLATPVRTPKGNKSVRMSPAAIRLMEARRRGGRLRSDDQVRPYTHAWIACMPRK
uniref:Uncharacterized protein n=1 Tax=Lotharella oceanica TaxID=641309 RepID=A0A7S2XB25_9EUKA|mmetsp:Transcript_26285/g.49058  ORF Transcript_26285/g.49058 Transcript_26285/m.49058 type:complete len:448 (+) Transcript_26285:62-1405(+)